LLLLLSGVVLLIHLWLAWWLAFLVTGTATIGSGLAFRMVMAGSAERKLASVSSPSSR
jgi:hypothetical protein